MIGILGAGLTGLTIGYLLHKMNIDFEILEKECECGGLLRSLNEDGFTFDVGGSHIIFSKDFEVLDFMQRLLGTNLIKKRRNTKILYCGYYVKYPFENGLADLPKNITYHCLYYFIKNLLEKREYKLDVINLKDWFYYTFGKGIAENYLIPYNEKIWKYPLEEIGIDWVERIPDPLLEDIVKSSLGIETEGYTHQLYFYYPRQGGIQSLVDLLEKEIQNNITKSYKIKTIRKESEKWLVTDGDTSKLYDKIISTIPIQSLINYLNPPNNIRLAASKLKYNSLITVMIGISKNKVNDYTWVYIPEGDILFHRLSFPSNYSGEMAPLGKSSILAEITCNYGDELWCFSDELIIGRTMDDLDKLNLINKKDVCFTRVKRVRYAYVINDIKYKKKLAILNRYIDNIDIHLVGRFSEYSYLNMDECIRSALSYIKRNYNKDINSL